MMTNNEWLAYVWQHYHILSSLVALAGIVAITIVAVSYTHLTLPTN